MSIRLLSLTYVLYKFYHTNYRLSREQSKNRYYYQVASRLLGRWADAAHLLEIRSVIIDGAKPTLRPLLKIHYLDIVAMPGLDASKYPAIHLQSRAYSAYADIVT